MEKKKIEGLKLEKKKEEDIIPLLCKSVFDVGKQKGLNISLSFKSTPRISNYIKSMKLDFFLPYKELTKQQNIFLTSQDPYTHAWKNKSPIPIIIQMNFKGLNTKTKN